MDVVVISDPLPVLPEVLRQRVRKQAKAKTMARKRALRSSCSTSSSCRPHFQKVRGRRRFSGGLQSSMCNIGKENEFSSELQCKRFHAQLAVVRQFIPAFRTSIHFMGSFSYGVLGLRPPGKDPPKDLVVTGTTGFIFIFLSAPRMDGGAVQGFTSSLDRPNSALRLEAQRSDKNGRRLSQICEHVRQGAEVVVAVRSGRGQQFHILGRTDNLRLESSAEFLLENGSFIIRESGSWRVHKSIMAKCLDAGLRAGIGLLPCRYPLHGHIKPKFCNACCWKPAMAVITFDDIGQEAADILEADVLEQEDPSKGRSSKRIDEQVVKREFHDSTHQMPNSVEKLPMVITRSEADVSRPGNSIGAITLRETSRSRRRWPIGTLTVAEASLHRPTLSTDCQGQGYAVGNGSERLAHITRTQNSLGVLCCSGDLGTTCVPGTLDEPRVVNPTKRRAGAFAASRSVSSDGLWLCQRLPVIEGDNSDTLQFSSQESVPEAATGGA